MSEIDQKPPPEPVGAPSAPALVEPGKPETPTVAASPPAPIAIQAIDGAIEAWWSDHFPGSAVARDTAAWNVAFTAKEDLKRRLAALSGV